MIAKQDGSDKKARYRATLKPTNNAWRESTTCSRAIMTARSGGERCFIRTANSVSRIVWRFCGPPLCTFTEKRRLMAYRTEAMAWQTAVIFCAVKPATLIRPLLTIYRPCSSRSFTTCSAFSPENENIPFWRSIKLKSRLTP